MVDGSEVATCLSALLATGRYPRGSPPGQVLRRARAERVHLLVADSVARAAEGEPPFPPDEIARLAGEMRAAAVDDVARTREMVRMAAALEAAGCRPIVFKGAALAHTHYRQPWLRPRLDVDVLVVEGGQEPASRALHDLGYERPPFVSGRLVMYQEPFVRAEAGGLEHVVDLHWRVANPQAVSRVLAHAELYLRWAGPGFAFYGLGISLYFASQGAGQVLGPVLGGVLSEISLAAPAFGAGVLSLGSGGSASSSSGSPAAAAVRWTTYCWQ